MEENEDKPIRLPEKYWCYKKPFQILVRSRRLLRDLLIDYRICIKCIFRIYSIEHPRMYADPEFYLEMLPLLFGESFLVDYSYNPSQCCLGNLCWLCEQVFQKSYSSKVGAEVNKQIKEKGFNNYKQFKLNIRIPPIILLRNILLVRFIYHQYQQLQIPTEELALYYNILVLPFQTNKFIDPKTILKWTIAAELNSCTHLTSTAEQNPDNLTISIEQDYTDQQVEKILMNHFKGRLGLQKKKQKMKRKKQKIDLGFQVEKMEDIKCNAANLSKVVSLRQGDFEAIFCKIKSSSEFWPFVIGRESVLACSCIQHKIVLYTKNAYICGRYIKYSRYLSQTPWMVQGQKLTDGSLQQQIEDKIFHLFYPGRTKQEVQIKFHAGGRQDIDVRMLQGGRPFVLEFVNPIRQVRDISEQQVIDSLTKEDQQIIKKQLSQWVGQRQQVDTNEFHSWRIVKLMELLVNHSTKLVQIHDLQETTESFISVELKAAEMQKIKHYLCYIYSVQQLTNEDKIKLDSLKDINLMQLTPLRVLHRRTLMVRDKVIHCLKFHQVSKHSGILQVWASAGTYIKEFVHGDLGRTTPNVGSLLGKEIDILQLDVGSLKEGQWIQGDENVLKMDKFEWMD